MPPLYWRARARAGRGGAVLFLRECGRMCTPTYGGLEICLKYSEKGRRRRKGSNLG